MNKRAPLSAFAAYGIEIEYAIVDRDTLDVRAIADRLLAEVAGAEVNEFADGPIGWSNELSLHVIELKTNGPAASLDGLDELFSAEVARIDALLTKHNARVLPGPMHPWMDPLTEQRLWPHEQNEIYAAYDRIFNCRGHGWANLQSMHINLPFANDAEFVRLHDAIRIALPLLPALAAASPYVDGKASGLLDTRLETYRLNQKRVPEITGRVIPDRVASIDEYHSRILAPMFEAIAPFDTDKVLDGEWLNSRGAIARFERGAIEIRILDAQESPRADLAVARAVVALVKALYEERHSARDAQVAVSTEVLATLFERSLRDGEQVVLDDASVLNALGLGTQPCTMGAAWQALCAGNGVLEGPGGEHVAALLKRAPLARRLLAVGGQAPTRDQLRNLYRGLCGALAENRLYA
ncbi:MAG: glutamate--cysteine ligase [Gammaproteobacteria bacterium]|nr:glutamate--cysteine ligase [Gammaproteobacteria bacterium]